jgi:hypothetical protein
MEEMKLTEPEIEVIKNLRNINNRLRRKLYFLIKNTAEQHLEDLPFL